MTELKKILYVEDQIDIQLVAQVALATIGGYELQVCSGGAEALGLVQAFAPDLLLLDVMMPGMDGPTLLAEVRKLDDVKDTPVIFMTAKLLPDEVAELMSLGALSVIAKPFDPVSLGKDIQQTWDQNQNAPQ